jgi:hypothetical protein
MLGQKPSDLLPQGIGDAPLLGHGTVVHGYASGHHTGDKPSAAAPKSYSLPGVIRIGSKESTMNTNTEIQGPGTYQPAHQPEGPSDDVVEAHR